METIEKTAEKTTGARHFARNTRASGFSLEETGASASRPATRMAPEGQARITGDVSGSLGGQSLTADAPPWVGRGHRRQGFAGRQRASPSLAKLECRRARTPQPALSH